MVGSRGSGLLSHVGGMKKDMGFSEPFHPTSAKRCASTLLGAALAAKSLVETFRGTVNSSSFALLTALDALCTSTS